MALLTPSVDVRRSGGPVRDRHRLAGLEALVLVRAPLRRATTPTSACCWSTTTTSSRRAAASRPTRTGTWRSSPGCCAAQLVHQDSQGHNGLIYPGLAQRMSAGTGILHSEKNDSWRLTGGDAHKDPVHFVQMWVCRTRTAASPATSSSRSTTTCCAAASSRSRAAVREHKDAAAISIGQRDAALCAARMAPGGVVSRPGRAVRARLRGRRLGRPRGHRSAGHRRRRPDHRGRRAAGDRRARGRRGAGLGDARRPGRLTGVPASFTDRHTSLRDARVAIRPCHERAGRRIAAGRRLLGAAAASTGAAVTSASW